MTDAVDSAPAHDPRRLSRRDVIRGAASAAAVGAVAAVAGPRSVQAWTARATRQVATTPREGGLLRVGMLAEPPSASISNPWQWNGVIGLARLGQVLEKLCEYGSEDGQAVPALATSWEPMGSADAWQVKLREGVTFHNGKPFTADDVVYSFLKILDEATAATPRSTLANVLDPDGITRVGDHELEFHLKVPYATFGNILSAQAFIVPDAWETSAEQPLAPGTGPFKLTSFEPGSVTKFARFDGYWGDGLPHVDEMQFLSIAEESARVNALLSGQVDVAHNMSPASIRSMEGRDDVTPFISDVAHSLKLVMASQRPPFDDVRVRQAFRLIVNRQEMVDQALSGFGVVANDLMCPFDPMYASDLPQREQDIDKAKSLLAEAGAEGLEVTLDTAADHAGSDRDGTTIRVAGRGGGSQGEHQHVAARQLLQ